jgi:hypothetical protein
MGQNIFSRCIEGHRVWLNLTSGEWVGREWPSQFHGSTAFVLARDDDLERGPGSLAERFPQETLP